MNKIISLYIIGLLVVAVACSQEMQWLLYIGTVILSISIILSTILIASAIRNVNKVK